MTQKMPPTKRLAVHLSAEEERAIVTLQAAWQLQLNKRLSLSEVVRIAIRNQLTVENTKTNYIVLESS